LYLQITAFAEGNFGLFKKLDNIQTTFYQSFAGKTDECVHFYEQLFACFRAKAALPLGSSP